MYKPESLELLREYVRRQAQELGDLEESFDLTVDQLEYWSSMQPGLESDFFYPSMLHIPSGYYERFEEFMTTLRRIEEFPGSRDLASRIVEMLDVLVEEEYAEGEE